MKLLLIIHFSLFTFHLSFAQFREVGTWKYYINSREYYDLENIEGNIFVNAKRCIFDVQLSPFEPIALERTSGLSDYSISTMAYNDTAKKLFVIYDNTMIDIIDFNQGLKSIKSNFDVYNKLIVADKTILQVKFFNKKAYLCSRLGIIVFNYTKNEMESTFIIGPNGSQLGVYTLEILGNKIYASTNLGIKEASLSQAINLQDFNNWSAPLSSIPNDTFIRSQQLVGKMHWMSKYTFYDFDGSSSTTLISKDTLRVFKQLRKINNKLYLIYDSLKPNKDFYSTKIISYDGSSFQLIKESIGNKLNDISFANNNFYFSGYGFFENQTTDLVRKGLSNHPFDNTFRLQLRQNRLIINMGVMQRNMDASLVKDGHFGYDNTWWYQSGIWSDSMADCTNEIASIERNGGIYRAYVRGGVSFEKEGQQPIRFRANNSKLDLPSPIPPNTVATHSISDMVYNPIDSSIWIANNGGPNALKCITNKGVWYSFDLTSVMTSNEIYRIIIDQVGNKWLLTRSDGVILFNEKDISNLSDNVVKQILEIKSKYCNLSVKTPLSAVVDREGNLWVGSDRGVGMITNCTYDPDQNCVFDVPSAQIKNPNDTTVYNECAFLNTAVTALAVDPGNNIWIGTPDGLFYNQEYISSEFLKLNKLNSPFSAKSIHDILIHPNTGEVFISTDVGLLSYMGQSSDAAIHEDMSPYRVIPNPVPKDFEGLITIDGLSENAYYKITDVVGNLMYQGQANGSRVTWDTRSLNGVKVPLGVYYIFSSKPLLKGIQGVGKFTIIR